MPNALLVLVADSGARHHTTWTVWHMVGAWAAIIALMVWVFRKMGQDLGNENDPPRDDPQAPKS